MVQRIQALVLCGPSGSGKSSLLRPMFDEFPDSFGFSVSHTSRSPRPGETDGVHYHFTTTEDMKSAIAKGRFIETAVYSNNMYGTSKSSVADVTSTGKLCVLDIDVEGVKQVKLSDLNAVYVFIKPPSIEVLEQRLRDRGTETEDSLRRRLAAAKTELEYADVPGNFDLVVTNDVLEEAYAKLRAFIVPILEQEKHGAANGD